jgi:hypothetical protein
MKLGEKLLQTYNKFIATQVQKEKQQKDNLLKAVALQLKALLKKYTKDFEKRAQEAAAKGEVYLEIDHFSCESDGLVKDDVLRCFLFDDHEYSLFRFCKDNKLTLAITLVSHTDHDSWDRTKYYRYIVRVHWNTYSFAHKTLEYKEML